MLFRSEPMMRSMTTPAGTVLLVEGMVYRVMPGTWPEVEEALRQMIAALPGTLLTANPLGQVDFVSPQWQVTTGLPLTELLGNGWLDAVHPDNREAISHEWKQAVQSSRPVMFEFRMTARHGRPRWYSLRVMPICDDKIGRAHV